MRNMKILKFTVLTGFAVALAFGKVWAEPTMNFHGQFRVNYFTESKSDETAFGDESKSAMRLRWRPTFDVKVDEKVSMHMQLNIGHINSGVGNHNDTSTFGLRHAYISLQLKDNLTGVAGIVPVSDKFGDTLFSGDWDFNPLTLAFLGKSGDIDYRLATAKISEGASEAGTDESFSGGDDFDIYIVDVDHKSGLGASLYHLRTGDEYKSTIVGSTYMEKADLTIFGIRYHKQLKSVNLSGWVMGSGLNMTDMGGPGSGNNPGSNGFAAKLQGKFSIGKATVGLMGIWASGDKDFGNASAGTAGSFITPMSIIGHTGYWGYTGKLNIQGPTDTGIDNSMVNIDGGSAGWNSASNLGYGITTIQGNLAWAVNDKLDAYLAIGWFRSADAPSTKGDDIGTDFYAQGKYNLGSHLNLEFGVDYVTLGKGHFGSWNGTEFKSRNIMLAFSRLQLEY